MLALDAVTLALGRRTVLAGVTASFSPGTLTAVIGPNGAGKSTLLRALAGELRPATGLVTLDGVDLATLPARALAARRAVMPQAARLAFPFLVSEVVALGLSVPGLVAPTGAATAVEQALAAARIDALRDRLYTELSGGERQRVHFARALCQVAAARTPPERTILLLDEPTASLDLPHQALLMARARQEARLGRTVIAVLHDLTLAAAWSDRIAALGHGRLAALGTPAEVLTTDTLSRLYEAPIVVARVPGSDLVTIVSGVAASADASGERFPCPDRALGAMQVPPAPPAESQPCD